MEAERVEDFQPYAREVEAARKLYAIDPERAFEELSDLAERGSAESLFLLGCIFRDGIEREKDIPRAKTLFISAVNAGSIKASFYLGFLYWRLKEFENAESTLLIGANKNYAPSLYYLAKFYFKGPKAYRNIPAALDLLEKASKQDHLFARRALAGCLMRGNKGLLGRFKGLLMMISSIVDAIKIYYIDPSSPKLEKNSAW